ncbi:MAG: hypothetical protein H0X62_16020 [Bacteroidetes bacterium]|nr:hypothetical protein [Bacteroidota bacterium]
MNKLLGITWLEYTSNEAIEIAISNSILFVGGLYILFAIASLIISNKATLVNKIAKVFVAAGAINLVFLAFLFSKEIFMDFAQFFEYAIQVAAPALLLFSCSKFSRQKMKLYLKIAISLTFISHGLYAIGYYPTPGNWVDMVIYTISVSDEQALGILKVAGYLDIFLGILIFVPKLLKPTMVYLFLWGLATTSARIYTNLYIDSLWTILEIYVHEVLVRIPHFLLPLLMLHLVWKEKHWLLDIGKIKGSEPSIR